MSREITYRQDLTKVDPFLEGLAGFPLIGGPCTIAVSRISEENENYDEIPAMLTNWVIDRETKDIKFKILHKPTFDFTDFELEAINKRLYQYLENNDYPINDDTRTLMLLLHELGHVKLIYEAVKHEFYKELDFIKEMTDKLLRTSMSYDKYYSLFKEEKIDITYKLNIEENACDHFALMNFGTAYKYLKGKGLIE